MADRRPHIFQFEEPCGDVRLSNARTKSGVRAVSSMRTDNVPNPAWCARHALPRIGCERIAAFHSWQYTLRTTKPPSLDISVTPKLPRITASSWVGHVCRTAGRVVLRHLRICRCATVTVLPIYWLQCRKHRTQYCVGQARVIENATNRKANKGNSCDPGTAAAGNRAAAMLPPLHQELIRRTWEHFHAPPLFRGARPASMRLGVFLLKIRCKVFGLTLLARSL